MVLTKGSCSVIVLTDYASYANICQQAVSCYIGSKAVTAFNRQLDTVLIQSLSRGEPVAYAAVANNLTSILPVAPMYRNVIEQLSDTTVDPLNKNEQALLDEKDGKKPVFKPYVDISTSTPQQP